MFESGFTNHEIVAEEWRHRRNQAMRLLDGYDRQYESSDGQDEQNDLDMVARELRKERRWEDLVQTLNVLDDPHDSRSNEQIMHPRQLRRNTIHGSVFQRPELSGVDREADSDDPDNLSNESDNHAQQRRASFQQSSSQAKQVHTGRKLHDVIEKVRRMKLSPNLFQRHQTPLLAPVSLSPTLDRNVSRILNSAFVVPFFAFTRDEHNLKHVPVILAAISISMRSGIESQAHGFLIDVEYGDMKWTVNRTFTDFVKLHSILSYRAFQKIIPFSPTFPSHWHYALQKARAAMPRPHQFNIIPKEVRRMRIAIQRRKALEQYLREALSVCNMRTSSDLCQFLELSQASLQNHLGEKGKEGYIQKRTVHRTETRCVPFSYHTWNTRWFMIGDSFVAYFHHCSDTSPRNVLLFDKHTGAKRSRDASHIPWDRHKILIANRQCVFEIRGDSDRHIQEWWMSLICTLQKSPWCQMNRFDSFAPVRTQCNARYFIDGHDYYETLAEYLLNAQDSILIEGWWISPTLYLRRPASKYPDYRLDKILKRKARQGVKIYIIMYKEVTMALGIDSLHSKSILRDTHENIKILRFPNHVGGTLYWALHDKVVVVDRLTAFVGGLDLCFGRYDTNDHRLADLPNGQGTTWPGIDYSNPRIRDFINVEQYDQDLIDRHETPRMPWHDIHCMIQGQAAVDVSRHFIERWNFVSQAKFGKESELLVPYPEICQEKIQERGYGGTCTVQVLRSACLWSLGLHEREQSIYNAYAECIRGSKHFIYIENQFFISDADGTNPSYGIHNTLAKEICDRIIHAHKNGEKFRVYVVLPLLPAFENELDNVNAAVIRTVLHWHQMTIYKGENSIFSVLRREGINLNKYISFCGLRTYDNISYKSFLPRYVSEQIYVHSKVMIVDDRIAIIGSANLNDRSMSGNRDSEVAVIIEDSEPVDSVMDGMPFIAAKFAYSIRTHLFQEHLGVLDLPLVQDPLCDFFFFNVWNHTAAMNTRVYHDVFRSIPNDSVETWQEYERFMSHPFKPKPGHVATNAPLELIERQLSEVRGSLVQYPYKFLSKENLNLVFPAREFIIPTDVFV